MRSFLSPGERRLLEALDSHPRQCAIYPTEGAFVRAVLEELDAHLAPSDEPETVGSMAAQLEIESGWGSRRVA